MNKRLIKALAGLALILLGGVLGAYWFVFRVYVPEGKCMVLIRQTGDPLPAGQQVADKPSQRGIRKEVLGPGRYFYNPLTWNHEIHDLTEISSGDPKTWEWIHSLDANQRNRVKAGTFQFNGRFPEVGVLVRRVGPKPPNGSPIVGRNSGYSGILREVLTPGEYKINPLIYEVQKYPATVIPAGFVGVVTNLFGVSDDGSVEQNNDLPAEPTQRRLAAAGSRGTVEEVLQPGIYFINPKLQKVTMIEIGFNEFSQVKVSDLENNRISFPSDTGYEIRVGVTVIWGIDPNNAANIINEFGNIDKVLDTVIGSQLSSICRRIGSTYAARDFIHGERREMFQKDLTKNLQDACQPKHVDILLVLVREIEVHAPAVQGHGDEVTEDLKRTIQQSYIAIEQRITKEKQREAAVVRAELEEAKKQVDIARETIVADTRVQVANVLAEADKEAAEIDAQAELEIAGIQQEIAGLDAQRREILGGADAEVEKLAKQAEADGYALLVNAFGSGRAYNLYTFAEEFEPETIRMIFAGEGTFWTDLTRMEDAAGAKILQNAGK